MVQKFCLLYQSLVSSMSHSWSRFQFPGWDKEKNTYPISFPFVVHPWWCTLKYVQSLLVNKESKWHFKPSKPYSVRVFKKQYLWLIRCRVKVPMKWNFSPLFYSRKLKSMLHWFIIFEFKLCSGAQNNFSIPPKLAKNAFFVFRGLELVTS